MTTTTKRTALVAAGVAIGGAAYLIVRYILRRVG